MHTLPNHHIKVNRALKLSEIGRYPNSASAMLAAIPDSLVAGLSARQIATIMDANWALAQASKVIAARDVLFEGGVWDSNRNSFRGLQA